MYYFFFLACILTSIYILLYASQTPLFACPQALSCKSLSCHIPIRKPISLTSPAYVDWRFFLRYWQIAYSNLKRGKSHTQKLGSSPVPEHTVVLILPRASPLTAVFFLWEEKQIYTDLSPAKAWFHPWVLPSHQWVLSSSPQHGWQGVTGCPSPKPISMLGPEKDLFYPILRVSRVREARG